MVSMMEEVDETLAPPGVEAGPGRVTLLLSEGNGVKGVVVVEVGTGPAGCGWKWADDDAVGSVAFEAFAGLVCAVGCVFVTVVVVVVAILGFLLSF